MVMKHLKRDRFTFRFSKLPL